MDLSSGQRSSRPSRPGVPRKPVGSGDTTRPNEEFNVLRMPAMYSQAVNPYPNSQGDASPSLTDSTKAKAGRDAFFDSTDSLEPYVDNGFYLGYATPYQQQPSSESQLEFGTTSGQRQTTSRSNALETPFEARNTDARNHDVRNHDARQAPFDPRKTSHDARQPPPDLRKLRATHDARQAPPDLRNDARKAPPDPRYSAVQPSVVQHPMVQASVVQASVVPDQATPERRQPATAHTTSHTSPQDRESSFSRNSYMGTPFSDESSDHAFDRSTNVEDIYSSYEAEGDEYTSQGYSSAQNYTPTPPPFADSRLSPQFSQDQFQEDVRSSYSGREYSPTATDYSPRQASRTGSSRDLFDVRSVASPLPASRSNGSISSSAKIPPVPTVDAVDSATSSSSVYGGRGSGSPAPSPLGDRKSEVSRKLSQTRSLAPPSSTSLPSQAASGGPISSEPVPEPPTDQQLGIGVGSEYVQYIRAKAGETYSSKRPAQLPRGLRGSGKSPALKVPPAFLRKAMDIRYTHLQPRMLASEVDDEVSGDGDSNSISAVDTNSGNGPLSTGSGVNLATANLTTVRTDSGRSSRSTVTTPHIRQRSPSPVESVRDGLGKIKLFVANPDE